jgi:AraC-like DNA-binding protein
MRAPWGFAIKERPLAAFHIVVSGSCELRVDGVDAPFQLNAGDMVIAPTGRAHTARSGANANVAYLDDILIARPPREGRLEYGGDGALTDLVCGGFELTDPTAVSLLGPLPPAIVVWGSDNAGNAQVRGALALALRELEAPDIGSETMLTRLTDVLLALALRDALRSMRLPGDAWRDAPIAAAIVAIEENPERHWTLKQLAAASALSRSAFSERFRSATGVPPMRFVARARLARAAALLSGGNGSVKQTAHSSGFGSEASFSRAFRRHFGTTPQTYRELRTGASQS